MHGERKVEELEKEEMSGKKRSTVERMFLPRRKLPYLGKLTVQAAAKRLPSVLLIPAGPAANHCMSTSRCVLPPTLFAF